MSIRVKPDEARRLAIEAALKAGLNRDQAGSLAASLLWFDTAGFPSMGLAALPDWLDRIAQGAIDPKAEPTISRERAGTAQIDGRNGLPQATLARAATIAGQKARELGLAIVRVQGIAPIQSAAPAAADLAIGPLAGLAIGPSGAWTIALPTVGGPPLVYDSAFGEPNPAESASLTAPWLPLLPDGGWLLLALNLPAFEPLDSFQRRAVEAASRPGSGRVDPHAWEDRRLAFQEHGIELPDSIHRN